MRLARGANPLLFGVDQVLSSLSNALLAFTVLSFATAAEFGRFSMGLAVLSIAVGVVRSGILEWEILDDRRRTDPRDLLAMSAVVSLAISVVGMAIIAAVGVVSIELALLFVLASATSAGCDAYRFAALARGRPIEACLVDGTWLGAMVVAVAVLVSTGRLSLGSVLLAYSISGLTGLAVGVVRADSAPARDRPKPRLGLRRTLFGSDFLLNVSSGYGVTILLPAVFGLALLGTYRAVITLFQPYTTVSYALRLWQLKRYDWSRPSWRPLVVAGGTQAFLGVVYAAPLLALSSAGVFDQINSLESVGVGVLVVGAIGEIARVVSQGAFDVARARDALGIVVGNRVLQLLLLLGATLIMTSWTGVAGTLGARILAYGVAMGGVVFCLVLMPEPRRSA